MCGKRRDAQIFLILSTVGHYSLFPLIFTPFGKGSKNAVCVCVCLSVGLWNVSVCTSVCCLCICVLFLCYVFGVYVNACVCVVVNVVVLCNVREVMALYTVYCGIFPDV